jgi:cytochrome c-type biogenesis protein CcmE
MKGGFPGMKTHIKFGVLMALVVGSLIWLAAGGISDTKTYYKTIAELGQMDNSARTQRLRVGGDVKPRSIVKKRLPSHIRASPGCQSLERGLYRNRSSARHL